MNKPALLAFEVTIDDMRCVTFAPNPRAAKWNAVNSAREAGYYHRRGGWPQSLTVTRVAYFDNSSNKQGAGRKCFAPESILYS